MTTMNPDDYKNATVAWYRERLAQHGAGIKALSSGTEERRAIRFGVLTGVGIEPGCSVLDVGCGFADYYAYLQEKSCAVAYTGVDLVPEFIEQAKRSFPSLDLQVRDLQKNPVAPASYDYVVCSQTFNLRFGRDSNLPLVAEMMGRMFAAARKGVAIDFVTDHVDFKEDYLVYHSPEAMFRLAKTLTKRVVLRHDYPLYEFCLYIYPDFQAWGRPA
jgi:SAM-dependent methyltransferase